MANREIEEPKRLPHNTLLIDKLKHTKPEQWLSVLGQNNFTSLNCILVEEKRFVPNHHTEGAEWEYTFTTPLAIAQDLNNVNTLQVLFEMGAHATYFPHLPDGSTANWYGSTAEYRLAKRMIPHQHLEDWGTWHDERYELSEIMYKVFDQELRLVFEDDNTHQSLPYYMLTSALFYAISSEQLDLVKKAIMCGANPNRPGPAKVTPYGLAISKQSLEVRELLLEAGANLDQPCAWKVRRNDDCNEIVTPLHYAAAHNWEEGVNWLLDRGAKVWTGFKLPVLQLVLESEKNGHIPYEPYLSPPKSYHHETVNRISCQTIHEHLNDFNSVEKVLSFFRKLCVASFGSTSMLLIYLYRQRLFPTHEMLNDRQLVLLFLDISVLNHDIKLTRLLLRHCHDINESFDGRNFDGEIWRRTTLLKSTVECEWFNPLTCDIITILLQKGGDLGMPGTDGRSLRQILLEKLQKKVKHPARPDKHEIRLLNLLIRKTKRGDSIH